MQIRKTTESRVAFFETLVVFYAFAAGATASDPPVALFDPSFLVRLAIPSIVVALVLLFRNACSDSKERVRYAAFLDLALSFVAAGASQAVLALLKPEFLLPQYRFTRGALLAWIFLGVLRAWFPHRLKALRETESQTPITIERLRWKVREFEVKVRQWSNWGTRSAVIAIGLLGAGLPFAGPRAQIASGLFIAGAVYMAWIIHKRGVPAALPVGGDWKEYTLYCRTELQHQSILLHRVWHWYFGSLVAGALLLLQGSNLYGYFGLIYVLLIGELNYRGIEWIRLQLSRIDLPHDSHPNALIRIPELPEA